MDYFGNDPRGVSERTQIQIDAYQSLEDEVRRLKSMLRFSLGHLESTHAIDLETDAIEDLMQRIDDLFHKALTDLENRIGS